MEPHVGVWVGGIVGVCALCLGAIKLWRPASPLHRWGGRLIVVPAVILLIGMIERLTSYQVPMRTASRGHALFGALAFVLFAAKFLARRNILVSPKRMNPIGYALAVLFPMAAAGMMLPACTMFGDAGARSRSALTVSRFVGRDMKPPPGVVV